jgi:hypothetical protein
VSFTAGSGNPAAQPVVTFLPKYLFMEQRLSEPAHQAWITGSTIPLMIY